jgi:hypothetical protein
MRRLLLMAAIVTVFACHAYAQVPTERCSGYVSDGAPYKLRAVLEAFCISVPTGTTFELDTSVQYGAYDSPSEFLLAYNRVTSSNAVEPLPLQIMRYDKQSRKLATAELSDFRTEILPGLVDQCRGSAGGAQKVGALFYVGIELSPSAQCQLVISEDLKLKTVLSGWPLASFSTGAVVLEGSMVHFAPTHPLRLSLFDARSATATSIYPPPSDPLRAAYIQRLGTKISQSDRCQGENCEPVPEQFDNELGARCESSGKCQPAIAVNEKTGSLAFLVKFSPIGFISFDKLKGSTEWDEQVIYVYQLLPGPVAHREFLSSDLKVRFGTTSLDDILTPEMLTRVFAK